MTLLAEQRISLSDLAIAERVSPSTAYRWCAVGARGFKPASVSHSVDSRPTGGRCRRATFFRAGAACGDLQFTSDE